MSMLTLAIIKNEKTRSIRVHYRNVIRLLDNKLRNINQIYSVAVEDKNPVPYDAGIIIINLDKKVIVNYQWAFSLHNLEKDSRKFLTKKYGIIGFI